MSVTTPRALRLAYTFGANINLGSTFAVNYGGGGASFPFTGPPTSLNRSSQVPPLARRGYIELVEFAIPIDFALPIDATGAPAPSALSLQAELDSSLGPLCSATLTVAQYELLAPKESLYMFTGLAQPPQPVPFQPNSGVILGLTALVTLPVPTVPAGTAPGTGGDAIIAPNAVFNHPAYVPQITIVGTWST